MTFSGLRGAGACACALVLLLGLLTLFGPLGAARDAAPSVDAHTAAPAATPVDAGRSSVPTAASEDPVGGVKLSGRVVFQGSPPARRAINMVKDAKCVELHGNKPVLDEELIVGDGGGLKNAFVSVRQGVPKIKYPLPEKAAVLDQQGCMYRPRVQGVRVGQKLMVGNGDPVTHNVRSFPTLNRAFNFGQPPDTDPRERVFDRAEREIEVQCDFHPWMHAYIFVMDHPFFSVSKDDGTYSIDALPPGEYTLETWHEKLGRQRRTVTVRDADLVDVDFTYKR
jgi:hypothetical protein